MTMDEDYLCIDLKDCGASDLSSLRKQFTKASRIEIDCDQCEEEVNYDNLSSLLQSHSDKLNYIQLTNLGEKFQLGSLGQLPLSVRQIHCYMRESEEPADGEAEGRKFPNLFEFKQLRALTLSGFNLRENSLKGIEELKDLFFLDLTESEVPVAELERLKKLTKLKHVYLSSCNLGDKTLVGLLSTNKSIQALDVNSNAEITDRSMEQISTLRDIRILNVMNLPLITDYYLEEIRSLTALNCQNCPLVSEPGLMKLLNLAENLRYLDVKKCRVSNELLEAALEDVKSRSAKKSLEISVDRVLKNKWDKLKCSSPLLKITDGTEDDK
ncbi:uncharacterized protein LOC107044366 [Diachasma alloeum]|uniref:uncharacterized protein LOC107044366 n=1 Tax=Diachasma alloeum TaxID=454923 RepID=UPI0007382487|nr:uncharacterized protein LOC107044366 [Diachasma alloeum]